MKDGLSDAALRLQAEADDINPFNVGEINDPLFQRFMPYLDFNDYTRSLRYAIAQARLDNITSHVSGLSIRSIIKELDFLDSEGKTINDPEWIQHYTGNEYSDKFGDLGENLPIVYTTSRMCDTDRKVYMIYAFLVDNYVNAISVSKPTRLVTVYRTEPSENFIKTCERELICYKNSVVGYGNPLYRKIIKLYNPVMFKRNDNCSIRIDRPKDIMVTRIMPLGYVCELIGNTNPVQVKLPPNC